MDSLEVTELLHAWREGDRASERALINAIYPVLREIAQGQLRRAPGHPTMRATELAHEAYERLRHRQPAMWQDRHHFFALTATIIRRILIDQLRRRQCEKHGGDMMALELDAGVVVEIEQTVDSMDLLALDQALTKLEVVDASSARVVMMRVFAGMNVNEVASALGLSVATVGRHWRFARAFLTNCLDS